MFAPGSRHSGPSWPRAQGSHLLERARVRIGSRGEHVVDVEAFGGDHLDAAGAHAADMGVVGHVQISTLLAAAAHPAP